MSDVAKCELCGEPMPPGEEMFKYHGYSGDCPKPKIGTDAFQKMKPLPRNQVDIVERLRGYNPPDRTLDDQRYMAVDIKEAADVIDALLAALIKLANEAAGMVELARPCIGNTNASCLKLRIDEATAAIVKAKP